VASSLVVDVDGVGVASPDVAAGVKGAAWRDALSTLTAEVESERSSAAIARQSETDERRKRERIEQEANERRRVADERINVLETQLRAVAEKGITVILPYLLSPPSRSHKVFSVYI
jgi:hypothetical protein